MRLAHSDQRETYKCEICDKSYRHTGSLKRHVRQVHEISCFKCQECSATYTQKYKLEKHITSGNHLVDFYCDCCKQWFAFRSMSALEKHIRIRNSHQAGLFVGCKSVPKDRYWVRNTESYHHSDRGKIYEKDYVYRYLPIIDW